MLFFCLYRPIAASMAMHSVMIAAPENAFFHIVMLFEVWLFVE